MTARWAPAACSRSPRRPSRGLPRARGKKVTTHLYGQEINAETYAIAKADLILKGEGEAADNIVGGPEWSTLSNDAFGDMEFDFMLSNPPYGKSWKKDLERMGGKDGMRDPRFVVEHAGDPEYSLVTRSSDGQLLFLANMASKMNHKTELGSRIAEVHNGSSLFTGDAGQGESNIRRWLIENDWLEAIVALPLNLFYNTGIATYVWVLTNRKPEHRKGKVQLIDATQWFKPLRKNLGKKNCELSAADIDRSSRRSSTFAMTRPTRRRTPRSSPTPSSATPRWSSSGPCGLAGVEAGPLYTAGRDPQTQGDVQARRARPADHQEGPQVPAPRRPAVRTLRGRVDGRPRVVEYEPDTDLRDTEQVPLTEPAGEWRDGIEAFIRREVLPHAPDAWIDETKTKIGYEISFTSALLQAATAAHARRDPRRHPRPRSRDRRPAQRDRRLMFPDLKPYPNYRETVVDRFAEVPIALGAQTPSVSVPRNRRAIFSRNGTSTFDEPEPGLVPAEDVRIPKRVIVCGRQRLCLPGATSF